MQVITALLGNQLIIKCKIVESNFKWPTNTLLIASDSILNNIDEKRLNKYNFKTKVRCFPGSTISDIHNYLIPLLKKEPGHILLHVGTNDATTKSSERILDELLQLKNFIQSKLPASVVIISEPTVCIDNAKASLTIHRLTEKLHQLDIMNGNITYDHISKRGLHLTGRGTGRIAMNILSLMKRL